MWSHGCRVLLFRLSLSVCALLVLFAPPVDGKPAQHHDPSRLAAIARRLGAELGVQIDIQVVVAKKNDRMVSVERASLKRDTFTVTFDRNFLSGLDQGEITAALAHEIGHIWIFCHFPYVHTEVLANEIALTLVDRIDLESLYRKLRDHLGASETVEEFLASNIPSTST